MNRRGVEFTLTQAEPGVWKWQFQIGETVTTGKTQSNLMGMAARRVQQRIDRELGKARDLARGRATMTASVSADRSMSTLEQCLIGAACDSPMYLWRSQSRLNSILFGTATFQFGFP